VVMPALGAAEFLRGAGTHQCRGPRALRPGARASARRGLGVFRPASDGGRRGAQARPQPALRPCFMLSHQGQTPGMRL
jgi:hypothetical protein